MRKTLDKKKRAPNYSAREKSVLVDIMMNYQHIVENKKTDSKSCQEKDRAWTRISELFNSRSKEGTPRNKESLRKCYDNLKLVTKRQMGSGQQGTKHSTERIREEVELQVEDEKCEKMLMDILCKKLGTNENSQNESSENKLFPDGPLNSPDLDGNGSYPVDHNYGVIDIEDDSEGERCALENNEVEWEDEETGSEMTQLFTDQKRPNKQKQTSMELTKDYAELAKIKMSLYQQEIETLKRRNTMENELHQLRKTKLLLEIKKTKLEIKTLQETRERSEI